MDNRTCARGQRSENLPARVAIVAITAPGAVIAFRLAEKLERSAAFVPARFARPANSTASSYDGSAAALITDLFRGRTPLVLLMAAGAAVRVLAPVLTDKTHDPPVVVVDAAGKFAVSLLSGHQGGANLLARQVADALGGTPVITTASEVAGVPPADLIGNELGWRIEPDSQLKAVAAALVNEDLVGLVQECGARRWLPEPRPPQLREFGTLDKLVDARPTAAILISDRIVQWPANIPTAIYRPPSLILGIGCVRGVGVAEIEQLVDATLRERALSPLAVALVTTIDRKAEEPGLIAFAEQRGWPLRTFTASELDGAPGPWQRSAVVRAAVGAGAVAEPAALLGAGASELTVPKVHTSRVTLAIARQPQEGNSADG